MSSRAFSASAAQLPTSPLWTELTCVEPARVPLSPNVLACIGYGHGSARSDDPRYAQVGLPVLGPENLKPRYELWHSTQHVDWDRDGSIGYAQDGDVIMGQLALLECELDQVGAATFRAYAQIIAFLGRHQYPHLLRCWNYLHDINRGAADHERYKQFCLGRYQALAASPGFERQLPAGTAIGMAEPGIVIYFLAARQPGLQVENPRQTPAFHYPRQYGPRSPSFSRATLRLTPSSGDAAPEVAHLMVSGTASVIGHATQHPHNAAAQLDETLANLRALLQHAATTQLRGRDGGCWTAESLKLYLRDAADFEFARRRIEQSLGPSAPVLYLQGAVCRSDLNVEIEGTFAAVNA
jgi:chorismate lyase/3-hydroxybenzoate synthase